MKKLHFILSLILLVSSIHTLSFADVEVSPSNSTFSIENLSTSQFSNPETRKQLQILFIDNVALDWIRTYKKLPTTIDLRKTYLSKLNVSLATIIGVKQHGIVGLFDSMPDLREKTLHRIIELNMKSQYPFLFTAYRDDTFHIQEKDLFDPAKRSELQLQVIDKYLLPWIEKNLGIFPLRYNFNKTPTGVGITPKLLFSTTEFPTRIGVFDSILHLKEMTYQRIKELGLENKYPFYREYDNEKKLRLLLADKDLNDPEIRKQVQLLFIEQYIIPWITSNDRFPSLKDFGVEEHQIGFYYNRVFRNPINSTTTLPLFKSLRELRLRCNEYVQASDTSLQYTVLSDSSSLLKSLNLNVALRNIKTPEERKKLQERFIIEYIIPWIQQYSRLPRSTDFGNQKHKIEIPYSVACSPSNLSVFESIYELRHETLKMLEQLHLNQLIEDILVSSLTQRINRMEFLDINTRNILQNIFITKYMIPWIKSHNGTFPSQTDFGYEEGKIGVPYQKVFKDQKTVEADVAVSLFSSIKELREKTHILLEQEKIRKHDESLGTPEQILAHKPLYYGISQKDLRIKHRRQTIQKLFISQYLFPFIKRNNGQFPTESDFGESYDKVGLSYQTVFGETLADGTQILGIFDSLEELQEQTQQNCVFLFGINMDN